MGDDKNESKILLSSILCAQKRKRINFKLSLEKELEEMLSKLDNDPNINTHKLYTLNKNKLEQIEKD